MQVWVVAGALCCTAAKQTRARNTVAIAAFQIPQPPAAAGGQPFPPHLGPPTLGKSGISRMDELINSRRGSGCSAVVTMVPAQDCRGGRGPAAAEGQGRELGGGALAAHTAASTVLCLIPSADGGPTPQANTASASTPAPSRQPP